MKSIILLFICVISFSTLFAQTGPWAKYDSKMKGEALVREADGGYLKEVKSIVEGGGDVNWQLQPSGLTALMTSSTMKYTEIVKFLLKQGADPKMKDAMGKTALDRARIAGSNEVVALLEAAMGTSPITPVKQTPIPDSAPQTNVPVQTDIHVTNPIAQTPDINIIDTKQIKVIRNTWVPFGTYKVGEEVSFFIGSWKRGRIKEVGSPGDYSSKRALSNERKYLIAREGAPNWNESMDWGSVTGINREKFWTDFFIGQWKLGEVMAVNTKKEGGYQRDEYSFHSATEALDIKANNTYRWKVIGGKVINGIWKAAEDGAGIVLLKGFQGLNWTLRNETNATEENIRGIQSARLTTEGKMSIKAKRAL